MKFKLYDRISASSQNSEKDHVICEARIHTRNCAEKSPSRCGVIGS